MKCILFFLVAVFGTFSAKAIPSLVGDTVNALVFTQGFVTYVNGSAVVADPGVEFPTSLVSNLDITVDFAASSLAVSIRRSNFAQLNLPAGVTFQLSSLNFAPNVILTDLLFTSGDLLISNVAVFNNGVNFTARAPNDLFLTNVTRTANFNFVTSSAVPESSATLLLLSMGLAGLIGYRRLRERLRPGSSRNGA